MSYSDYDNSATGYVYVIRFGNRVKVGFSINPEKRFDHLPYEEVVAVIPGCRWVEGAFHDLLRPWRVCGEWFRCSPQMLALIQEELVWYRENPCRCGRCALSNRTGLNGDDTAINGRYDREEQKKHDRRRAVIYDRQLAGRWPQPQPEPRQLWWDQVPRQLTLFNLLEPKLRARRRRGTPHPRSVTT